MPEDEQPAARSNGPEGSTPGVPDPESAGPRPDAEEAAPDSGATTVLPSTTSPPDSGATTVLPSKSSPPPAGPSGTTILPAVPGDAPPPGPATPTWSGRAEVRATPMPRKATPTEQWELGEEPDRGVGMPILITLGVIILLGLIGIGLWAALRDHDTTPTPTPSLTVAATTAAATTQGPPTTTAAAPADVEVPGVQGISEGDAVAAISGRGLTPVIERQASTTVPAGFVIGTDPVGGSVVAANSEVRLIVSTGPPPPTEEPPSPPTETATATP